VGGVGRRDTLNGGNISANAPPVSDVVVCSAAFGVVVHRGGEKQTCSARESVCVCQNMRSLLAAPLSIQIPHTSVYGLPRPGSSSVLACQFFFTFGQKVTFAVKTVNSV